MQRIDSEATDDSPFGSVLATPVDEKLSPLEITHTRLFSHMDLQATEQAKRQRIHHDELNGNGNVQLLVKEEADTAECEVRGSFVAARNCAHSLADTVVLCISQYLESVGFSARDASPPPPGFRRYAHWAECVLAHVLLFVISIAIVGMCTPVVLVVLAGPCYGGLQVRREHAAGEG